MKLTKELILYFLLLDVSIVWAILILVYDKFKLAVVFPIGYIIFFSVALTEEMNSKWCL